MNQKHRDISIDDLREMIITALTADHWTTEQIAGYVAAQEASGWLRVSCPAWLRNSAAVHYCIPPADGFGDSPKRYKLPIIQSNATAR